MFRELFSRKRPAVPTVPTPDEIAAAAATAEAAKCRLGRARMAMIEAIRPWQQGGQMTEQPVREAELAAAYDAYVAANLAHRALLEQPLEVWPADTYD